MHCLVLDKPMSRPTHFQAASSKPTSKRKYFVMDKWGLGWRASFTMLWVTVLKVKSPDQQHECHLVRNANTGAPSQMSWNRNCVGGSSSLCFNQCHLQCYLKFPSNPVVLCHTIMSIPFILLLPQVDPWTSSMSITEAHHGPVGLWEMQNPRPHPRPKEWESAF